MQPDDIPIVARVVAEAVKKATAPLLVEIETLKARQPERGDVGPKGDPGPEGPAGKDAAVDLDLLALKAAELIPVPKDGDKGEPGPIGPAGKDADAPDYDLIASEVAAKSAPVVLRMVEDEVKAAIAALPPPLNGKDGAPGADGKDGRDGVDGKDGAAGRDGIDGKDGNNGLDGAPGRDGLDGKDADPITPELVLEALSASPDLFREAVAIYLKANPPANGKDGADGKDGRDGLNGKDGADGLQGKEGPEGKPGRDGQTGLPGRDGEKGADGRDGLDGLGFDDIDVQHDGERSFTFAFKRGDRAKTFGAFTIPSVIYRDVYVNGQAYRAGDAATFGGSLWIAKCDTKSKPGTNADWKLAVKRGADGKDKA